MLIRKNLEFSPRSSVRSSVRQSQPFSKSVHYFFLKLCAFLIIFTVLAILAKNCPKLAFLAQNAQKMEVFAFLSHSVHQNLLIFCTKPSLWSRKKMTFSHFLGKFKNGPFWPKLTQIWPKFGHLAEKQRFFAFLSKSIHQNSLIFCFKPSRSSRKKNDVFTFLRNFQKSSFLAKIDQNLA